MINKNPNNMQTKNEDKTESQPSTRGRKRDPKRDVVILDSAIEVLAESGYNGMTMDMVASRAKAGKATVYRRWNSKAELVVDAIAHLKHSEIDLESLPDTGTLRGDLLALFKPETAEVGKRKMRIMAGLASVLLENPQLAEAGDEAIVKPWATINRILMVRARDRGEIAANADINAVSRVIPSMAAYRALIQRKPFDLPFLTTIIDGVLLPALSKRE
ncbi:TetR/AcrR family transcriptional regulator [Vibrio sp. ABG19]|uniref:TetR/AcrR family transcriptional regulator n=1 Tax=Vibrio sp. ABG19 TaxID=2817385 RepID=UPI00249F232A|nr:TetR/AcrR family transcriptional regulator [Vibrio sp. ABG19]WGY47165.1 TetR/AcrR family transcriptional regulator [Vibrio sp. ABG19]